MARLLGIVTPADDTRSRLALLGQWSLTGLVFLTGLVAPLVWLPYMAVPYHRATTRLTDRATLHYVGSRDPRPTRTARLQPEMVPNGLRALGSILVPAVGVVLIALPLVTAPMVVGGLGSQLPVCAV
ncbi:hypothetical protein ABZX98_31080 [Streptomyces sp. NPDC002992]|uniref:hypothetical protein n=1 Tax=Streptomyces sp. NPDC002992 TaxID=3154273 RepID=UPI0033BBC4F2